MQVLELKVPPVLVLLIATIGVYVTRDLVSSSILTDLFVRVDFSASTSPEIRHENAEQIVSWIAKSVFVFAVIVGLMGAITVRRSKTTLDPVNISKASALVTHGVFSYTRNPMYLAMLLVLFSFCIKTQNPFGLLIVVAFVMYMNRFQIIPEEKMLLSLFGEAYQAYLNSVRRWI